MRDFFANESRYAFKLFYILCQVWETTMNVVGSNQCVEEGHSLLRALLRSHRGRIGKSASARFYENTANRVLKCSPTSVSIP